MQVYSNATSLIRTVRLVDDAGDPITAVAYNDASLEVAVRTQSAATWTVLTLVDGTLGSYLANSWKADPDGDGLHQLCLPDSVVVAGAVTNIRVTYGANPPQYDTVEAVLLNPVDTASSLSRIYTKTDQIGSAGAITSLLAGAVLEPGTITSFPEVLTIGDSYTENNGREIQIPIVDTDGNPISSTGSLNFADATVTFAISRANETDSSRIITGTAEFVDPPGTGTGAGAPYVVVQLPSSETSKGLTKYKYSGVLTFTWSGTGTDVMSFETATITFDN